MNTTTLNYLDVNYSIDTVHGDRLEFVIDAASDKTGRSYYDELNSMIDKVLLNTGFSFVECGAYGDVWLTIRVDSVNSVDMARKLVDKTINKWINKFRINKMRDN